MDYPRKTTEEATVAPQADPEDRRETIENQNAFIAFAHHQEQAVEDYYNGLRRLFTTESGDERVECIYVASSGIKTFHHMRRQAGDPLFQVLDLKFYITDTARPASTGGQVNIRMIVSNQDTTGGIVVYKSLIEYFSATAAHSAATEGYWFDRYVDYTEGVQNHFRCQLGDGEHLEPVMRCANLIRQHLRELDFE